MVKSIVTLLLALSLVLPLRAQLAECCRCAEAQAAVAVAQPSVDRGCCDEPAESLPPVDQPSDSGCGGSMACCGASITLGQPMPSLAGWELRPSVHRVGMPDDLTLGSPHVSLLKRPPRSATLF